MTGRLSDTLGVIDVLKLSPSAVKLLVALHTIGGTRPFAASNMQMMAMTNMGYGTVVTARSELILAQALVAEQPPGYYSLPDQDIVRKSDASVPLKTNTGICAETPSKSRKKKDWKKGTRAVQKSDDLRKLVEARRLTVKAACAALRAPETARFVQMAMRKLHALEADGFTHADALEVCRAARERYDAGDRFAPLLNLVNIWSVRQFTGILTAARTTPFHRKEFSVIADPDTRREWGEDYQRRLREKGLA